jgi:hypothetical protein
MKKVLKAFLLLALAASAAHPQERPAAGGARLIDSFGEIERR